MSWLIDLDGVVWLADLPIPGASEAVARLRAAGKRVAFVTNNSAFTVKEQLNKLRDMDIPAADDELVTSAQAAAALVDPGDTVLVCAGRGVDEALQRRGVRTARTGRVDAVIVGWHREFDYDRLTAAFRAVRGGARLIGTNADPTYPMAGGPVPGGGSLLAAVVYAAEAEPEIAGKPNRAMVNLIRSRVGAVEVVVGDRPSTDGALARRLNARFALVLTGVTDKAGIPEDPAPDVVAPDLGGLVP